MALYSVSKSDQKSGRKGKVNMIQPHTPTFSINLHLREFLESDVFCLFGNFYYVPFLPLRTGRGLVWFPTEFKSTPHT